MQQDIAIPHTPDIPQADDEVPAGKRTLGRTVVYVTIFALIGLLGWKMVTGFGGPLEAGAAPDFTLNAYDGTTFTLSEHRGHVVIINFWASWCDPCREEAAYLESTWRKYADQGVIFVGVDYLDTESEALAYLEEFDITYLNGLDTGTRISDDYRIQGVPETFYVDKSGQLRGVHIGPLVPPTLDEKIEELLAEPYPAE
jgi:cytochrome c biogenesis protein CcmG/thiol:disulfide interchange protein DsbE